MEKKPEQIHPDNWLKDLSLQPQNEAFKPEEMLVCPKCERLSPPNRLKCFYCNGELPVTEIQFLKPNLRKLETWEKGFNIVCLPDNLNQEELNISEVAKLLKLEQEDTRKILAAGKALPIARAESETEAEIVAARLKESGVDSFILSDEKLKIETVTRRLRGIEFFDDRLVLILFNADEIVEISHEDLCLIVSGALFARKIESTEKHNRKKENEIVEAIELSSDELLIDIYSRDDTIGYRIESKGFDFSGLENEKQLLANENMKSLVEKLRTVAPNAKFDGDYRRLRNELGKIWEVEQRKDSKGLHKKGFGKFNLESVTTVDNLSQFTKYSRLQRQLL
jgi:hypothetical protein